LNKLDRKQKLLIDKKYKQIINLHKALRLLKDKNLPTQYDTEKKVAEPRNFAIHYGSEVTKEVAKTAIDFTEAILKSRLPI
jgi:hypothetical protein